MFYNIVKTAMLFGCLSAILLFLGNLIGGVAGIEMALILSIAMNAFAYFFSDKIVLRMYKAHPLSRDTHASVHQMVEELATTMQIPKPKLWLIDSPVANAFATGRNPSHASVALTTGVISLLDQHELRAVLAHELGHVQNRDILITTVAATLAGAISYIAYYLQRVAIWRSFAGSRDRRANNPLILLVISIVVPIAASLVQLALSRTREFLADETGACTTKEPLALASALEKLENHTRRAHFDADAYHASTASLFIVHPFFGKNISNWFATHPPIPARIERLKALNNKMFS